MPFVNEVVTDDDIDAYGLPFRKGRPRYWTHDRQNRRYLWGGISENPGIDDVREGRFHFYTGQVLYKIRLDPGHKPDSLKETPFRREWKAMLSIDPLPKSLEEHSRVVVELKEALDVFGYDGRKNTYAPLRVITYGF